MIKNVNNISFMIFIDTFNVCHILKIKLITVEAITLKYKIKRNEVYYSNLYILNSIKYENIPGYNISQKIYDKDINCYFVIIFHYTIPR